MLTDGNFEVVYTGGMTENFAVIEDAYEFMNEVGSCDLWYGEALLRSRIYDHESGDFITEDYPSQYELIGVSAPK